MESNHSPYVFRDEREPTPQYHVSETDVVIVDGAAMTYRAYRR
ncbi:hypothetical protein [Natronocalculus amylovorans]|nr:hypothetical protein [Natronocalculus amylovorans]